MNSENSSHFEKPTIYPTLVVGVGGMGTNTVRAVKRRFRNVWGGDQLPGMIQLMALDTEPLVNRLDQEPLFADEFADLVFTDPPYNAPINGHVRPSSGQFEEFAEASGEMTTEEFTEFLRSYLAVAKEVTRPGALIYSFMDWRHMREMLAAVDIVGLDHLNHCIWVKPNGGMGSFYRSRHEQVFVLRHPGAPHTNNVALGANGRYRTNVWEYAGATGGRADEVYDFSLHPTVKPVRLVEDAILDATAAGETVFDPFLGSGTTLLAAERTRRRCIGVEFSPAYVDVAIRRWEALTGGEAIHDASGMTFAERADTAPAAEDASASQDGAPTPEEGDV